MEVRTSPKETRVRVRIPDHLQAEGTHRRIDPQDSGQRFLPVSPGDAIELSTPGDRVRIGDAVLTLEADGALALSIESQDRVPARAAA